MGKYVWEVESVDSIDYSIPEATYTGKTEVFGNTYRSKVSENLTEGMMLALSDPDMQQWKAVTDACNELTGVTDWIFDVQASTVKYQDPNLSGDFIYQLPMPNQPENMRYGTITNMCNLAVEENNAASESWIGYPDRFKLTGTTETNAVNTYGYCNLLRRDSLNPSWGHVLVDNWAIFAVSEIVDVPELSITFDTVCRKIVLNASSQDQGVSLAAEAFMDKVANDFVNPEFDDSVVPESPPDYVCNISKGIINYQEIARGRYSYLLDTPEFDALIQTILEHRMKRQCEYFKLKDSFLDIDKSHGLALDAIGRLVGQSRTLLNFIVDPYFGFLGARNAQAFNIGYWYTLNSASKGTMKILNDEQYRRVLKARIIKNNTRNTRRDLVDVLKLLGGESTTMTIQYRRHGVIEVGVNTVTDPDGILSYFLSKYLDKDSIIPRQFGYRIGQLYEEIRYLTSRLYPVFPEPEELESTISFDSMMKRDLFFNYNAGNESLSSTIDFDSMSKRDIIIKLRDLHESISSDVSLDSISKKDLVKKLELVYESVESTTNLDSISKRDIVIRMNIFNENISSTANLDAISKKDVMIRTGTYTEEVGATTNLDSITTTAIMVKEPFNITYKILE